MSPLRADQYIFSACWVVACRSSSKQSLISCSYHIGSGLDACIHAVGSRVIALASYMYMYALIQGFRGSELSVNPLMSRSPLSLYPPCLLLTFHSQLHTIAAV